MQIFSEGGELSDTILKKLGLKPKKREDDTVEIELADILYAIICLANSQGIDIQKALLDKIGINEKRDKKRFEK